MNLSKENARKYRYFFPLMGSHRKQLYLIMAFIALSVLITPNLSAQSDDGLETDEIKRARSLVARADSLYATGQYASSAQLYEQIVALNKADAGSVYRLGLSYHMDGNYPKAIKAHQMASSYPENRPNSIYNLACAYSLAGDIDRAFEALNSAIDAGYISGLITSDSDLDNMRNDPRFQEILRRTLGEGYTGFDGPGPTTDQMREGIQLLVKTIQARHPNPYRHFSKEEWDGHIEATLKRVESLDEVGYYAEVRQIAGMVGDVHTSAYPMRGSDVLKDAFALRLWYFEDGLYIRATAPELEHLIGAKVLAIQGIPIDQAWKKVMSKMKTENMWMSYYMAQFHMQFPAYLHALGLGDSPKGGQWTLLMANGDRQDVYLETTESPGYLGAIGTSLGIEAPKGWKQGHDLHVEAPLWIKNRDKYYWYEYLQDYGAVFMQFNIPRRHGQPWKNFLQEMFEFIQKNNDVEKLIIDLRHNEGGWAYMSQALVQGVLKTAKINKPGHLFVLLGRNTQSAGVTIAASLELETYAIFVGEPCGAHPNFYNGPMGNHPPNALPGTDIVFRVSTESEQNSDPLDNRCYIAPDIPAAMAYEDYSSGRDKALEAALTLSYEQGREFFLDAGGREIPLYFHWRRPTQKDAFEKK
jgi:hypothetical protein